MAVWPTAVGSSPDPLSTTITSVRSAGQSCWRRESEAVGQMRRAAGRQHHDRHERPRPPTPPFGRSPGSTGWPRGPWSGRAAAGEGRTSASMPEVANQRLRRLAISIAGSCSFNGSRQEREQRLVADLPPRRLDLRRASSAAPAARARSPRAPAASRRRVAAAACDRGAGAAEPDRVVVQPGAGPALGPVSARPPPAVSARAPRRRSS